MRLSYNYENDRYGILNEMDLWQNSGLHCGDHIKVFYNNEWINDRIEMNIREEWYLVETGYKGKELEGLKVKIN